MAEATHYEDREQAWVKHWMLQRYLEKLIFKVGTRWQQFIYIDAFAGPWGARTEDLSDTSFGVAIKVMADCQARLAERGIKLPMRAVFFETNRRAAARLQQFAVTHSTPELQINAYQADFMEHVESVASGISPGDFAFAFIDPTGYKDMVPERLAPLLRLRGVEVLINLMWDFINRFWELEQEAEHLDAIFGRDRLLVTCRSRLETDASKLYAQRLRDVSGGSGGRLWASTFPVQHPSKERTHYFLAYATHAPSGLLTFDEVAEQTWEEQAITKAKASIRRKAGGTASMFPDYPLEVSAKRSVEVQSIRNSILKQLPNVGSTSSITSAFMAELLEENACLCCDLQRQIRQMILDGVIENPQLDASALRRRTKNVVKVDKNEVLRRIQ